MTDERELRAERLRAVAMRKHEAACERAQGGLDELVSTHQPVTFRPAESPPRGFVTVRNRMTGAAASAAGQSGAGAAELVTRHAVRKRSLSDSDGP